MSRTTVIEERFADATLNLALDTIGKGKQALVFCNTKRGAESQAEKIAQKIGEPKDAEMLNALADRALKAVSSPTKQCRRLAMCLKGGIAFHHAGLHSQQRELVETAFRDGTLSVICATPTLAMGMDLPAFRSIIRDLKRYSQGTSWGMSDIPVLEYEQMAGRAGRPGKETAGEAVCIAATPEEEERIVDHYVRGDPEDIYSKLAVEPVLRTYVLSLIASGYVQSQAALERFFGDTFYAFQYGDMSRIQSQLGRMVQMLAEWGFLEAPAVQQGDFVMASEVVDGTLRATKIGERVAQLYLDPLTAHELLTALERAAANNLRPTPFALLHLVANTLELRPLFNVRQGEIDMLDKTLVAIEKDLFVPGPSIYSAEYEEFLQTVKTATVLRDWIEEMGEDNILEGYNVAPGELHAKRDRADWILHSLSELVKLRGMPALVNELEKLRVRLEHGAKEELLALLRLKGVGRVRGRALYKNGIRTLDDLRTAEVSALRALVGNALAIDLKDQVGIKVAPEDVQVKSNKRKGQIALGDYDGKE